LKGQIAPVHPKGSVLGHLKSGVQRELDVLVTKKLFHITTRHIFRYDEKVRRESRGTHESGKARTSQHKKEKCNFPNFANRYVQTNVWVKNSTTVCNNNNNVSFTENYCGTSAREARQAGEARSRLKVLL
jgi:hypothetical protein